VTATEVLANIDAMSQAIQGVAPRDDLTVDQLLAFHRRLLTGTRLEARAGTIRTQQNWIGGSDYNPCSADFVPPPPEQVEALLDDLCAFCNGDDLPAVAQAAIAHAQFETIHPFVEGNGRTGRALIHLVLRRRGLAVRVLPPVSLILATWARDYVEGLAATRYRGAATSRAAQDGLNLWVGRFAVACRRAVDDAASFETRVQAIERGWRDRVGRVRAQSATDLLLRALLGAPVVSVNSASELIGRSFPQTNEAIGRLVEAGALTQVRLADATVRSRPPRSSMRSPTWSASSPARRGTRASANRHAASRISARSGNPSEGDARRTQGRRQAPPTFGYRVVGDLVRVAGSCSRDCAARATLTDIRMWRVPGFMPCG